ncbi:MAG: hypothetical protein KF861_09760 [Planctomycetaceae bacterium]|nr:hypothetical protein [Planctomycetaceae bacterium]
MNSKIALLLLVSWIVGPSALADGIIDTRLRLTVNPQFGAIRGQAPLPLSVTLNWSEASLLEGRLQLKWYVDRTHLGTYVLPETSLSLNSITRTILLPPVIMPYDSAVFSVQGEFHTSTQVYDLDTHDVAVPLDWRRTFVVALCREPPLRMDVDDPDSQTNRRTRLIESLRFEEFFSERFAAREISTLVVEVDPRNLPTTAEQLLSFDMLVLPGDRFDQLRDSQWEVIATWVRAGGSLCCLVDGAVDEPHVAFLNQLAAADPAEFPYLRTDGGHLLPVTGEPHGIDLHPTGLGRLAVVRGPLDFNRREWQKTLLFLWKARQDRIVDWELGRPWPQSPPIDQHGYQLPNTFEPQRHQAIDQMTELLLPESVQGLPLMTVAAMLVLFLLAIAPGDYFLLGWLRRRRWTWVLFPALSLLFTWTMMALAARHLGTTNLGRSITIVDLSSEGRPLRTTRLDLLYAASNRNEVTPLNGSLMVPIDPNTRETGAARDSTPQAPRYEIPWTYVGNMPGHHAVERTVRQWSPRLSRTTTLGPGETPAESPLVDFDWQSVTPDQLQDPETFAAFQETLRQLDPSVDVGLLSNTMTIELGNDFPRRTQVFDFLKIVSAVGDSRLFSIVSQISPTAAGQWEDLALVDPTDGETLLLLVMTESSPGQYVAYRQFFPKAP